MIASRMGSRVLQPNPVMLNELRSSLRSGKFVLFFTLALTLVAACLMIVAVSMSIDSVSSDPGISARIGQILVWISIGGQVLVILLILPGYCAPAITEEYANKTFDLLITSTIRPQTIIAGKFAAAMAYYSIFLIGALPLCYVGFLFGGVSHKDIVLAYVALLFLAAIAVMYGVLCSAKAKTTKKALGRVYGGIGALALILLMIGGPVTAFAFHGGGGLGLFFSGPGVLQKFIGVIGIPVFFALVMMAGCFLDATNRLKSDVEDKAMSKRIYFFAWFTLLLILLYAMARSGPVPSLNLVEEMVIFQLFFGLLILIHTLFFSLDTWKSSRRIEGTASRMQGPKAIFRILLQGRARGLIFISLSGTLLLWFSYLLCAELYAWRSSVSAVQASSGASGMAWKMLHITLFINLFCLFVGLVTFCLATLIRKQMIVRGLAIVLILVLFSFSWLDLMRRTRDDPSNQLREGITALHLCQYEQDANEYTEVYSELHWGYYLNPIMVLVHLCSKEDGKRIVDNVALPGGAKAPFYYVSMAAYSCLIIFFSMLALVLYRRRMIAEQKQHLEIEVTEEKVLEDDPA